MIRTLVSVVREPGGYITVPPPQRSAPEDRSLRGGLPIIVEGHLQRDDGVPGVPWSR